MATLGSLFAVLGPAAPASAHDYCLKQGYDWGCVKYDHERISACDAETDGNVVFSRGWYRNQSGYLTQVAYAEDPDGSGGECDIDWVSSGLVNEFEVCERTPGGTTYCVNTL